MSDEEIELCPLSFYTKLGIVHCEREPGHEGVHENYSKHPPYTLISGSEG